MVTARIQSEELDVEHVREPRDGMPIRCVRRRQCPFCAGPGQTRPDHWVFRQILWIVPIDEPVGCDASINDPDPQREGSHDEPLIAANTRVASRRDNWLFPRVTRWFTTGGQ